MLLTGLLFFSCQKDDTSVMQNTATGLTKTAPLALLIARVTQHATHCDDVLDHSDCYSIKLPVALTIDGHQVTVNSEDDYDVVETIMQQSNTDDDIVHFAYPVTVVFANFSELVVTSQQQLEGIPCGDEDFNEIRCINFNFPIAINTYDMGTQAATVVTMENDTQLYDFIQNAATSNLFTIAYPVTVTLSGGQPLTISSNNDLENAIEDSIDDCDNDHSGGPGTEQQELSAFICDGSWRVSYCSEASNYNGYSFTFHSSGTVTAVKAAEVSHGSWQLFDDGDLKMELEFGSPVLHGLENEDWKVTEYNTANFRLKDDHHGKSRPGGGNEYVYFTKN